MLFTTEPLILTAIAQHDHAIARERNDNDAATQLRLSPCKAPRPGTAGADVTGSIPPAAMTVHDASFDDVVEGLCALSVGVDEGGWRGQLLQLNLTHTWGDKWYLGLCGLEVLDAHGAAIGLRADQLDANPRCFDVISTRQSPVAHFTCGSISHNWLISLFLKTRPL